MSMLKPKDGDYITRGLILLIAWTCVIAPGLFATLGALLAGPGGAAVALFVGILAGIGGYSRYLDYGLKKARARV